MADKFVKSPVLTLKLPTKGRQYECTAMACESALQFAEISPNGPLVIANWNNAAINGESANCMQLSGSHRNNP